MLKLFWAMLYSCLVLFPAPIQVWGSELDCPTPPKEHFESRAKKTPDIRDELGSGLYEVLEVKPTQNGGRLLRAKTRPGEPDMFHPSSEFQTGHIYAFTKYYPKTMKKFGYRMLPDGSIEFLDSAGLNGHFEWLTRAGDPLAPTARFYEVTGTVDKLTFAKRAAQGEYAISRAGTELFHDCFSHVPGYALLPTEVIEASKSRLQVLLTAFDDPALVRIKPEIKKLIEFEVDEIDALSASLGRLLRFPEMRKKSILNMFNGIANGDYKMTEFAAQIGKRTKSGVHLTSKELAALEKQLIRYPPISISEKNLEELAQKTLKKMQAAER